MAKFGKPYEGAVYAIAIATGTSAATGDRYQNILVSKNAEPRNRSQYSYFLDPQDEETLNKLGITDLEPYYSEDGSRKVTVLKKCPILFEEGTLLTVEHAPYFIYARGYDSSSADPKYRCIDSTSVVAGPTEDAMTLATNAIRRAYANAVGFGRGDQFLDDYRRWLVFRVSPEEIANRLFEVDDDEP